MKHIVLCTGMNIDGGAEVNSLANVSGVGFSPLIGGIFLNLLVNGGRCVLGIDGSRGVGGGQTTQSAHGGVDQIVTQFQAGENDSGSFDTVIAIFQSALNRGNAVSFGIGQSQLCKGSNPIVIICTVPGSISIIANGHVVQCAGTGLKEIRPCTGDLVGVSAGSGVITFQIQDLVDLVSIAEACAIDGDGAIGRECISKNRNAQRGNHHHDKKKRNQFFHIYFPFFLIVFHGILFAAQSFTAVRRPIASSFPVCASKKFRIPGKSALCLRPKVCRSYGPPCPWREVRDHPYPIGTGW